MAMQQHTVRHESRKQYARGRLELGSTARSREGGDRSSGLTVITMRAVRRADVDYARTKTEERLKRSKNGTAPEHSRKRWHITDSIRVQKLPFFQEGRRYCVGVLRSKSLCVLEAVHVFRKGRARWVEYKGIECSMGHKAFLRNRGR